MFGNKSAGLHGIVSLSRKSRRGRKEKDVLAAWRKETATEALNRAAASRETYFAFVRSIRGLQ